MHWSRVTPWVVEDVPQNFKMGPPPALDSELYKASYMQVGVFELICHHAHMYYMS
jgi:hypothetical protein